LLLSSWRQAAPQHLVVGTTTRNARSCPSHPYAVAIMIAPPAVIQNARCLCRIVGEHADFRIPDPEQRRHRPRRHLPQIAEGALDQARAVHGHREGATYLAIAEDRIRLRGIAVGAQVEHHVGVHVAGIGIQLDLHRRPSALDQFGRDELLAHVDLIGDQLRHRDAKIGCEAPNEPADPRPARKKAVGPQLDRLARLQLTKRYDRRRLLASERRRLPLIAGNRPQQVSRQDTHVVDGVVEHLGIPLAEAEDGRQRVPRGDAGDALQLRAMR
jgi:hypothetical protein